MEPQKRVRGNKEYRSFQQGKRLTRGQAILAMCYDCLGGEGLNEDCCGTACPLYQYFPSRCKKIENRPLEATKLHFQKENRGQ